MAFKPQEPTKLDAKDQAILDRRMARYIANDGPAVGDYVIFPDGEYRRFTHDHGDRIQTTTKGDEFGSSFYLTEDGFMSFSGGLDPGLHKTDLVRMDEYRPGWIWFFHHGESTAHNGVNVEIPCRVYRYLPASKRD